jgi:hypothetical protein
MLFLTVVISWIENSQSRHSVMSRRLVRDDAGFFRQLAENGTPEYQVSAVWLYLSFDRTLLHDCCPCTMWLNDLDFGVVLLKARFEVFG